MVPSTPEPALHSQAGLNQIRALSVRSNPDFYTSAVLPAPPGPWHGCQPRSRAARRAAISPSDVPISRRSACSRCSAAAMSRCRSARDCCTCPAWPRSACRRCSSVAACCASSAARCSAPWMVLPTSALRSRGPELPPTPDLGRRPDVTAQPGPARARRGARPSAASADAMASRRCATWPSMPATTPASSVERDSRPRTRPGAAWCDLDATLPRSLVAKTAHLPGKVRRFRYSATLFPWAKAGPHPEARIPGRPPPAANVVAPASCNSPRRRIRRRRFLLIVMIFSWSFCSLGRAGCPAHLVRRHCHVNLARAAWSRG